jgi:hypothetical protein
MPLFGFFFLDEVTLSIASGRREEVNAPAGRHRQLPHPVKKVMEEGKNSPMAKLKESKEELEQLRRMAKEEQKNAKKASLLRHDGSVETYTSGGGGSESPASG